MNQYSELLLYIKSLGEQDVFINTITQGDLQESYLSKADVYPLLHISIDSGSFTNGSTVLFNVLLECVALRDINKEIKTDKFFSNDNEVDNHNETLASLNRLWNLMYKDFEDKNITASENPTLNKITYDKSNIVDGWSIEFNVEMPNTEIRLCS